MHYEFTESASESNTPSESPATNPTTRHRGIAAEGILFHAINSAGVETKAWYSRVSWQDKRHTLSLGPIESRAQELDRQARQRLSTGVPIDEVKIWLATQTTATAAQSTAPVASSGDSVVPHAPGKVTLRQVIAAHEAAYFDALPQTTRRYRANATDRVVFERLWQAAGANPANPRPFLKFALSRVVGISAARRAILPDGRIALELLSYPGSRNNARTEQEIITNFLEKVGADHGQLVGYNSAAADLPVLIQRATATGCHCPKFGARPASRSKDFDYFDRGSEAHLDLMQHLAHGAHHPSAAIPSLHQFAAACGIPGKLGHDGSSVVDLWLGGRHRDIIGYKLVFPERDGRTILVPFASPDIGDLLAALRNHSIKSVEDWHPLDPR